MLNGKPIKDYDFMTRAFNLFSPVSLNLEESEIQQVGYYMSREKKYFLTRSGNLLHQKKNGIKIKI